jgi:hypothetical protein
MMRCRRRTLASLVTLALAVSGGFWIGPSRAAIVLSVDVKPSSGHAGAAAVVTFSVDRRRPCRTTTIRWDGPAGPVLAGAAEYQYSAAVRIPLDAVPGIHSVYVVNGCGASGYGRFQVVPPPRPTPSRSRSSQPSTPPSGASTLSPTPSTSSGPWASLLPVPFSPKGTGQLVFDRDNVRPGDPLTSTGAGCDPGAQVTLIAGDEQVGSATADPAGTFTAPVRFSRFDPGRRTVIAACGIVLTGQVDLIVSSSTGGHAGAVIVLVLFLLMSAVLLRWQFNGSHPIPERSGRAVIHGCRERECPPREP